MGDQVIPVKVASRIRPLSEMELGNGCQDVISVVPGRPQIVFKNSDKAFTYDYVYEPDSFQEDVYEDTVSELIEGCFEG